MFKFTIKTPERRCSNVFIVSLQRLSHLCLVFQLLTLNKQMLAGIRPSCLHCFCVILM